MDPRLSALFARGNRGIKFDLARMRAMLGAAGDPHEGVPAVLVAGTNGKGSLTAMWTRGLRSAGHAVGTYTSPHLVRVNERIAVDERAITDAQLAAAIDVLERCERGTGITLTFFEAMTFAALWHFKQARVTALVLEVGMGGRLDATNVVTPVLSIITTIGLDHMEFLGDTEAAIAREKAGILRAEVPAVIGDLSAEALAAVRAEAERIGAPLSELGASRDGPKAAMFGAHQRHNAALFALSALAATPLRLSDADIAAGAQGTVRGRYEVIVKDEVRYVIDGAHNGPAISALGAALAEDPAFARGVLVFGGTQGRALDGTLLAIAGRFDHVIVCEPPTERAIPLRDLQAALPTAHAAKSVGDALALARTLAKHVCVTGSLYLVGEALAVLAGGSRDAVSDYR